MLNLSAKTISHSLVLKRINSLWYTSCNRAKLLSNSKRWTQTKNQKNTPITTVKRPPVVTIMGHVDHGKTTLLDHLRNSHIVEQEFGGITQHIGAFVVPFKNKNDTELVTFLDTPGHAAFAAMRQRGANLTDIVVLVVACEDGVLDQTAESIKYAKASEVPIIVAVNKIDKYPDPKTLAKNIELLRKQLIVHDVVTEPDGGDVQIVQISALKGIGVEDLKEAILALAETLELKAEVDCPVSGRVIESSVDPHRGKLCTIMVQKGQLVKGNILLAGSKNWAKVRALFDERNQLRQVCTPGQPIQVTGWREADLPAAGDPIMEVESENEAKRIIHQLMSSKLEEKSYEDAKVAAQRAEEWYSIYKEKLVEKLKSKRRYRRIYMHPRGQRPKESAEDDGSNDSKINLIIKCDVDGSLDAILDILDTYDRDNLQPVKLDIMHYGVGMISENDLSLAMSFPNSVIYGFNTKPAQQNLMLKAKQGDIQLRLFNVIYHLIDDLKLRLSAKMPEQELHIEQGQAQVMQQFVVSETNKKKSLVAGCRCNSGSLTRDALYKLVRNDEVVTSDLKVKTLKHFKEDVKLIEKNKECGISFEDLDDAVEFKMGDRLVAYEKRKIRPKIKWNIKGFDQ